MRISASSCEVDKLVLIRREGGAMAAGPVEALLVYALKPFAVLFSCITLDDNISIIYKAERERTAVKPLV